VYTYITEVYVSTCHLQCSKERFCSVVKSHFAVRSRAILQCGQEPFCSVVKSHFAVRSRAILQCGQEPFCSAVKSHFAVRSSDQTVKVTVKISWPDQLSPQTRCLPGHVVVIQPVLLRTIAALFDASASSTFARRMECSTVHAEGSASETKCPYA